MAAGLLNPVTGKNFEPSWRIDEFLPEALEFYSWVERQLGTKLWYPLPVLRLAGSEKEWGKISAKLDDERVRRWVGGLREAPPGWVGAVEVAGGGRLDVKRFVEESRRCFESRGCFDEGDAERVILCEGAVGLISGKYGKHRSAKGEILTLKASGWDESQIRVGGGGWLVPVGEGVFRAGATYEWNELDERPTAKGRDFVEGIVRKLGGGDFSVTDHQAGIRPILRRSEPLIGRMGDGWMFNGLGSKGSLYAPGVASRLVSAMVDGEEIEPDLDFGKFSGF